MSGTSTFGRFSLFLLLWRVLGDFGGCGGPGPVVRVKSLCKEKKM